MKKNIILSLALGFSALILFAQDSPNPPAGAKSENRNPNATPQERAKLTTDKLSSIVQLTTDQYPKVLEANTTYFIQRAALKSSGQSNEDLRSKFKALGEERDTKLKAILTPEQWKKRDDAHKAQMNERGSFRHGEE